MLLSGPSQVGKTQFALDTAGSIALGRPMLGAECNQAKVGFFSLEMNAAEIKEFIFKQAATYTPEELELLEQNLLLFPLGEPLYMNKPETRNQLEQAVSDWSLSGIIVD